MAVLQSRRIQEPREIVMSDDATNFLTQRNFLWFLGLRPGNRIYDMILGTVSGIDLSRAAAGIEPYYRMQMIRRPEEEDEYVVADPRAYSDDEQEAAAGGEQNSLPSEVSSEKEKEDPEDVTP